MHLKHRATDGVHPGAPTGESFHGHTSAVSCGYPARLGTKLINGWTAQKVSGYLVTISEGKHVWTAPMRGGVASGVINTTTLQAINDLSGPLPPGGPMAGAIFSGK